MYHHRRYTKPPGERLTYLNKAQQDEYSDLYMIIDHLVDGNLERAGLGSPLTYPTCEEVAWFIRRLECLEARNYKLARATTQRN